MLFTPPPPLPHSTTPPPPPHPPNPNTHLYDHQSVVASIRWRFKAAWTCFEERRKVGRLFQRQVTLFVCLFENWRR